MAKRKKQSPSKQRDKLSDLLRQMLGTTASPEMLAHADKDGMLLKRMQQGDSLPTLSRLLAQKVIRLALDPDKAYQWAVELCFDRTEGKPVAAEQVKERRKVLDRLDDITAKQIDAITDKYDDDAKQRDAGAGASGRPGGFDSEHLAGPGDRPAGPQGAPRESPVETGAS